MAIELGDFIEAAGLLEYDPVAIRKIYQGNPRRLLKRLWETLIPISFFLIKVAIDKLFGLLEEKKRIKARAKEFSTLLVQLGPAFIKAGQALSTRPDIIPTILLEELAELQDQLPGFDGNLAMECIQEDLGKPIEEIFFSIDKKPISAASLGQVHKAILKDGTAVAVKVQRPGLREQITLDLYIVRNIAIWLKKYINLIRSDLVGLIDELGKRIFEEMDYINEAKNAKKFYNLHKKNKNIAVPIVYDFATSRRVLTMEWIDGVKLTNLEAVKNLGLEPDEMIDIGVNCSLQQLLEHGFFHADPHPGNLLALSDGRLCYLDFGMMSEVSKESRTGLIQAVVHLVNKNFEKLSNDFVSLGFLSNNIDLRPIVPAFEVVFNKALEVGVNQMDFKAVTNDLSGVMYKFPFKVPPYYALIIRSLITLEGIALSVDPNFKILGASYPYFARRLMEDPDPQLRKSLKEMLFTENNFSWDRLEELINSVSNQTELNIEDLMNQIINFTFSINGETIRREITDITIKKLDDISWYIINIINQKLPQVLKSKRIDKYNQNNIKNLNSTKEFFSVIKKIPGVKSKVIFKLIPRLFLESNARKMGFNVFKGVTEKNIIRIVKIAVN